MGCSLSKKRRRRDSNPRVFNVINFDNQGQERNPGKIEITETHLVLTQRGKDAIRWPLNSLRRYGYEEELFSFESGRKSPTGAGIYAFKCRRAEALFNLLQDCIQRAGQEEQRLPISLGTDIDNASRPTSLVELPLRDLPAAGSLDSHLYVNGMSPPEIHLTSPMNPAALANRSHEYINYNLNPPSNEIADPQAIQLVNSNPLSQVNAEPAIQYAELLHNEESLAASNGHVAYGFMDPNESSLPVYINVPANSNEIKASSPNLGANKQNGKPPMLHKQVESAESPRDYANLALGGPSKVQCAPGMKQNPGIRLCYAELDLANSIDSVTGGMSQVPECAIGPAQPASPTSHTSSPESPCKLQTASAAAAAAERAYATIDFDRTKAMQDARLTNNGRADDGSRKTRHNSNVDELYP